MRSRAASVRWFLFSLALLCAASANGQALNEAPDSHLSLLLRLQAELVHADGSIPEDLDRKGWHITDAWANGAPNSSNWGGVFLDLGHRLSDDLQAVARYAINVDVDGRKDADRDIFVGLLSQRFGQVRIGRLGSPYKTAGIAWDPFNATFLQARGNQGVSSGQFGHGSYFNRAVSYNHSLQEIQFAAFVAIDDSSDPGTGSTRGNHVHSASLIVPRGPLQFMLAYINGSEYRGRADDSTASKLGIRYSQGPWTASVRYERRGRGLEDGDFVALAGSYKQANWTYSLGYGQFSDKRAGRDDDGEYFALGIQYAFRQGVAMHGGFRRTDRDVTGTENMFGLGLRVWYNTGNLLAR